jgi:Fe2+ or Zn2+ uptake regulation protein
MAGRPSKSVVRDKLISIMETKQEPLTGYQLYKEYIKSNPKCTLRLIYYHLKVGLSKHIFVVQKVSSEQGSYSWGDSAQKTYYSLVK